MNTILQKINAELSSYYIARAQDNSQAKQVGWRDDDAQCRRFEVLASLFDRSHPFSVNDLGCGLGAFYGFLRQSGPADFLYHGYDVLPEMIQSARSIHGGSDAPVFSVIQESDEMEMADYSVASGIFSLKASLPEHEWLYYILHTLAVLNQKSRVGFGFNLLTRYSDPPYMKPELYYADPSFLFDYCKRNFARNVALRHDYDEYDFTILVRK